VRPRAALAPAGAAGRALGAFSPVAGGLETG